MIDGEPHVLKHVHIDNDWTMRFFHETSCIPLDVWRAGLMDVLPERIDHGMVGAAGGLGRDGLGAALLMRDLGDVLVPAGDEPLSMQTHLQLLDGLAALSAQMWGWQDTVGLLPLANRWLPFGDADIEAERQLGWPNLVPEDRRRGLGAVFRTGRRATYAHWCATCEPIRGRLSTRCQRTPLTFLHGDWKLGNLGVHADGRVALIDWTYCGQGPICFELGWYLAINAARLPHPKEDAISALRSALEAEGITTSEWWERQLSLCLLGRSCCSAGRKRSGATTSWGGGAIGHAKERGTFEHRRRGGAYSAGASAWASGPARVYQPLAELLVDFSPLPLGGRLRTGPGQRHGGRVARRPRRRGSRDRRRPGARNAAVRPR